MPNRRRRLRPATDSHVEHYRPTPTGRRRVQLRHVPVNRTVVFSERPIENSQGEFVDSLTAAAQVVTGPQHKYIPGRDTTKGRPGVQKWQGEVWDLRDETPELRFLGDRTARAASRVTLFIGKKDNPVDDPTPVTDDPVISDLNEQLFGNAGQVAQVMKRAAQHVTNNGETYLLISQDPDTGRLTWQAYSSSEVSGSAQTKLTVSDGMNSREVAEDEILTRAWNPHPKQLAFPDCPVRACLPIARELKALTQMVSAQTDSRLAGAGVLLLPEGIQSAFDLQAPDDWPEDQEYTVGDELTDYMTTPISDRASAASVVPYILTVAPEMVDKIKHITFDSPLDPKLPELRGEAIRRLGLGMDSDPSVLLGMTGANHWCKDESTEVFTQDRGWITHHDLQIGDIILTLNHESGDAEWQPVQGIYRARVENEPMLSMESGSHSSLSTDEHRWPILKTGLKVAGSRRRWTTSGEGFSAGDRVPVAAPLGNGPEVAKWDDDFVRLMAAFTSDGSILRYESGTQYVRIVKFDAWEIAELRRVIRSVFGREVAEHHHPTRTIDGISFVLHADESQALIALADEKKAIHREFIDQLTTAQLHLFLNAMIELGDGVTSGSARTFYQVEPSRLDAVEMAAILAGYKVTRGQRNQQTGFGTEPLHWLRVTPARTSFAPHYCERRWVEYTGVVWCPTTPNRTWFARRNGQVFYTGNSGWLVSEDEVKLGVEPVVATVCHGMTIGALHPILTSMGVADPESYVVWLDATPLQLRPDRSKDAQALYDKGALSGEAMRRENGFGDDDAPTKQEAERALLIDLLKGAPSLAPILLPKLGIEIDQPVLSDAQKIVQATEGEPTTSEPAPAADPPDNTDNRSLPARPDAPEEPK